jgi:hypothetical protein
MSSGKTESVKTVRLKLTFLAAAELIAGGQSLGAAQTHVVLDRSETNFAYTVFNDEPTNSSVHLYAVYLLVHAPVDISGSPVGWNFNTDHKTYVEWFNVTDPPYSNDIPPGASLAGFVVKSMLPPQLPYTSESSSYVISTWDHAATNSTPSASGSVESPGIATVAPLFSRPSFSSGVFSSDLVGIPDYVYGIYGSTNLMDWSLLLTNISPFTVIESNSIAIPPGIPRFYRANFMQPDPDFEPD